MVGPTNEERSCSVGRYDCEFGKQIHLEKFCLDEGRMGKMPPFKAHLSVLERTVPVKSKRAPRSCLRKGVGTTNDSE